MGSRVDTQWVRIACGHCDGTGITCHGHGEYTYERTCEYCEGTGAVDALAEDHDPSVWLPDDRQAA